MYGWQYIAPYIAKCKAQLMAVMLASLMSTALSLIVPSLNGDLIDLLTTSDDYERVLRSALVIVALSLIGILATYAATIITVSITAKTSFNLTSRTILHMQKIPYDKFVAEFNPAYLIQRINSDSGTILSFFTNNFAGVFMQAVILSLSMILMATINLTIFFASLFFIPIYIACYAAVRNPMHDRNYAFKEESNKFSKILYEQIAGVLRIKTDAAFGLSIKEEERGFNDYYKRVMSLNKINYVFNSLDSIIEVVFQCFVLLFGGLLIVNGELTIGGFVVVNIYFTLMLSSVKYYFNLGKSYQEYKASVLRMDEIYSISEEPNGKLDVPAPSEIRAESITYTYPGKDKNVLSEVSVTIKKGEITTIVGPNGSGKTTLANVLIGILGPMPEGTICYDGHDIREIDMYHFRSSHLSVLLQCDQCPDVTVGKFIIDTLGANLDEVEKIIREMSLGSVYLDSSPSLIDYWDSPFNSLSGGEKRKVMLLKALGKKSGMIILDEPTTFLDKKGSDDLASYLRRAKADNIILMITHDSRMIAISDKQITMGGEVSASVV